MKDTIRYPEHFAPIAEEEMVYLDGGSVLDNVGNAIDDAVDTATSALNVLGIVATVVGVCVLGSSYIWGIRQADAWLDNNAEGNIFTILAEPSTTWRRYVPVPLPLHPRPGSHHHGGGPVAAEHPAADPWLIYFWLQTVAFLRGSHPRAGWNVSVLNKPNLCKEKEHYYGNDRSYAR